MCISLVRCHCVLFLEPVLLIQAHLVHSCWWILPKIWFDLVLYQCWARILYEFYHMRQALLKDKWLFHLFRLIYLSMRSWCLSVWLKAACIYQLKIYPLQFNFSQSPNLKAFFHTHLLWLFVSSPKLIWTDQSLQFYVLQQAFMNSSFKFFLRASFSLLSPSCTQEIVLQEHFRAHSFTLQAIKL